MVCQAERVKLGGNYLHDQDESWLEFQTCVKKMRLDMPVLNEDFVGSDKEDDVVRQEGDLLPDVSHKKTFYYIYRKYSDTLTLYPTCPKI